MYDVEAGQVVITRDVNFDESTNVLSVDRPSEEVDDATLDFDLLEINEEDVRQVDYMQTITGIDRPINNSARPTQHKSGLEETSALDNSFGPHQKRRLSTREE